MTTDPQEPESSEEMLQIPANVLVACPMVRATTRLEKCIPCEHRDRTMLVDRFGEGSEQPFAVRYLLRCKYPRSLPLQEFKE